MHKKWHINRRTFLRGIGASLALPALDIMILNEKAFANSITPHFFFDFVPNGYYSEANNNYVPRHMISAVDKLGSYGGYVAKLNNPFRYKEMNHPHIENFLSFTRGKYFYLKDYNSNNPVAGNSNYTKTFDQYLVEAHQESLNAPIRTLSLVLDYNENRTNLSYRAFSWRGPGQYVPFYYNPREVYQKLFSFKPEAQKVSTSTNSQGLQSVLDTVKESINQLNKKASAKDKIKLDQYFSGIREVERGISNLEKTTKEFNCNIASNLNQQYAEKNYQPETFKARLDIMQELLLIAHECEITYNSNLMRSYPTSTLNNSWVSGFKGSNKSWHGLSHYDQAFHTSGPKKGEPFQGNGTNLTVNGQDFQLINKWHANNFTDFALKMKNRKDPLGKSLLDKALLVHGSCQGRGPVHDPSNLFYLIAGTAGGRIKPNVRIEQSQTLTNLWLTLMKRFGVNIAKFGNSTSEISQI